MFTHLGNQILEKPQGEIWSVMLGVVRSLLAFAPNTVFKQPEPDR
jgi:hypothetical protein